jgi:tetratricopeptide (TPR) repeat protein
VSLADSILCKEVPRADEINEAFLEQTHAELISSLASTGIRNPYALSSFIIDLCQPDPDDRMRDAREAHRAFEMIAPELSPRQVIPISTIFVGRREELREIERMLTDPASGKKVMLLSGSQGIGKKSICWKAAQSAQLKGFIPVDLTPASSYFSLDLLTGALGSSLDAGYNERLLSTLPVWARVDRGHEKLELSPGKATTVFATIIDFLIETSFSQPILIIVSDIEHCSDDLLSFIVQLVKRMEGSTPQISLLTTSNTSFLDQAEISEALSRIVRSPISKVVDIHPFDDKLLKQLLTAWFGRTLLPEKERRDLISKTQGLPLLITAFLKNLLTANVVQYEDGHWIIDRKLYKQTRTPADLDHALATAVRDLPVGQLALLRLVALNGPMAKTELSLLANGIVEDSEKALASLVEKAILVNRTNEIISCAHPLYAGFIIENTPPKILLDYSGHLADRLVSQGSSDSLRVAQLCISAERLDEAVKYGFDAVDKMYSSYMLYDCLKLLQELRNLALKGGNRTQVVAVLEKLAPIEKMTGLPKEAIEDYDTLVDSTSSESKKAEYYMQMAQIQYDLLGNLQNAKIMLQRALRSATRAGESRMVAAVYYGLGGLSPEKGIYFYEKAAALSRETDVDLHLMALAILAYKYQLAGLARKASVIQETIIRDIDKANLAAKKQIYFHLQSRSFYMADYKAARFYILKKIQLDKKTESSSELVFSMSSLAGCYYTEGSFYRMIDTLKEAYNTGMRYNNYLIAITILANLSLGYRTIADYGQSLKMLLRAQEVITREGVQELNAAFLNKPTMLYVMLGKAKEAEFKASARRLYERARKTKNRIGSGHHSMAFALYHLNKLQAEEALIHAKKALSLFKQAADRDDVVSALVHIGMIQISLGKPKLARTNIEQAEKIYEEIHCEYLKPLLMLGKATLARFERLEDAKKVLADALRTSKKMGTREITWQIHREFALYYKDRGEPHKALSCYRDAVETIKQITETIDEEELKMSYLAVPFRKRVFDEIKALKRK